MKRPGSAASARVDRRSGIPGLHTSGAAGRRPFIVVGYQWMAQRRNLQGGYGHGPAHPVLRALRLRHGRLFERHQ